MPIVINDIKQGTPEDMKKQHFYSFAFLHFKGNLTTAAAIYIGYPQKFVSIPQIKAAKESASIHPGAVMLSCCYLGKLTEEEMKNGITRRFTLTGKARAVFAKLKDIVNFPGS